MNGNVNFRMISKIKEDQEQYVDWNNKHTHTHEKHPEVQVDWNWQTQWGL